LNGLKKKLQDAIKEETHIKEEIDIKQKKQFKTLEDINRT